jgi:hypothetical protein
MKFFTSSGPRRTLDPGNASLGDVLGIRGQVRNRAVAIAAVERLVSPTNDLDVLLRHRLLREPRGFKGPLFVVEVLEVRDPPAIEAGDDRELPAHLESASLPDVPDGAECQHTVTEVANIVKLDLEDLEGLLDVPQERSDAIVSPSGALDGSNPGLEYAILVEGGQPCIEVPPVESLSCFEKAVHVPLRHLEPSICARKAPGNPSN